MTRRLLVLFFHAWLACFAGSALAVFDPVNDDTDIFLANPSFASTRPNVLIFVDNTANWSQSGGTATKYEGVRAALKAVLKNTVTDAYNVGLGMFVETGNPNNSTDGAYIRYGVRRMTGSETDLDSNKGKLIKLIDALSENGDKGNNATFSLAMAEMLNYFGGRNSYSGHGKDKADAGDTVQVTGGTPLRQAIPGSPLPDSARAGNASPHAYLSPIVDGCQKNFIIFISNGEASDNSSSLATAATLYQQQTGTVPTTISLTPSGSEGILADEYAKYMANSDCYAALPGVQTVQTYTLDVLPKSSGQGPAHTALLKSMALNGKGKYFAITDLNNTSQIETALTTIFQEVQAVNSVFASTTLPVSVNVRGTNLNQVYIGVFRPDPNKNPRWLGNLKMYKLAVDSATQQLFLADRNGNPAENEGTGFITGNASSFWNERNNVDFWKFRDASLNGVGGNFELPDGDLVEKGGVAQQLRATNAATQVNRKVYTCTGSAAGLCASGDALSATPFVAGDSTIIGPADVGAYVTVPVTALSSVPDPSPATSATVTADTATEHGLAAGNTVRVEGASPAAYNGDFTVLSVVASSTRTVTAITQAGGVATALSVGHGFTDGQQVTITGALEAGYNVTARITFIDADRFSYPVNPATPSPATVGPFTATRSPRFAYSIPVAPAANRARATSTASHLIATGDTVIIDTSPDDYDTPGTGSSATVVNATTLEYTAGTISGSHTGATPFTARTQKTITSLSGSGTTATAVAPGHGYGAVGSTLSGVTIGGAAEAAFNTTSPVTINITSLDSFSYTTPSTITGTTNTAQAKATGHTFATGGYVHVRDSSIAAYNTISGTTVGTPHTVSSVQGAFFNFASTQTLAGTGGAAGVIVTGISYPGGNNNTATVTTATAHGFQATTPATTVRFFASGGNFIASNACTGYNNASFTVTGTPSATSFTITAWRQCPTALPAGAIVGFLIDTAGTNPGINPIVTASGAPYAQREFNIASITPLSTATGSITAGNPAVGDTALRDAIVNWARGQDNKENENIDCTGAPYFPCSSSTSVGTTPRLTDVRASVHGDVLHSRPATINYSRFPTDESQPANDNDIYVFYGSNDGILRAIKGGVASDESGINPGDERWAFIPKEFFPKLKRLRDNTPGVSGLTPKDYFFDGSIGVYQKDVTPPGGRAGTIKASEGDKVHLFVSLRRGGNFLYALDVTDPAAPKLLWRKGQGDAGWGEVGQTWSEPKVTRINWAFDPVNNPDNVVVIFGAGYDNEVEDINACLLAEWNSDNVVRKAIGSGTVTYTSAGSCTISNATGSTVSVPRSKGRGILVVDAFSGNVLWQVGRAPAGATKNLPHPDMTCAVSSDVSVLDRNRDGFADRLYVGDLCANVWRAEISDPNRDRWKVTKIAAMATGANTSMAGKRKFQFPPDLVLARDNDTLSPNYFAVLLGAGDREHPFDATVQNTFFMVKDRDASSTSQEGAENNTTRSIGGGVSSSSTPPVGYADVFDATNVDGVNAFGWRIDLLPGEKAVGSAVTVSGTTFFNTNQPSATAGGGACGSNLGIARQYLVSYIDGAATVDLNGLGTLTTANRSTIREGGGYLPSPVPIVVDIDNKKHQVVCSGIACLSPGGLTLDARLRTYWYKEIDQ